MKENRTKRMFLFSNFLTQVHKFYWLSVSSKCVDELQTSNENFFCLFTRHGHTHKTDAFFFCFLTNNLRIGSFDIRLSSKQTNWTGKVLKRKKTTTKKLIKNTQTNQPQFIYKWMNNKKKQHKHIIVKSLAKLDLFACLWARLNHNKHRILNEDFVPCDFPFYLRIFLCYLVLFPSSSSKSTNINELIDK